MLGQTDVAHQDLTKARQLAPDDKAIVKELHSLASTRKADAEAEKQMFKGKLGFTAPAKRRAAATSDEGKGTGGVLVNGSGAVTDVVDYGAMSWMIKAILAIAGLFRGLYEMLFLSMGRVRSAST